MPLCEHCAKSLKEMCIWHVSCLFLHQSLIITVIIIKVLIHTKLYNYTVHKFSLSNFCKSVQYTHTQAPGFTSTHILRSWQQQIINALGFAAEEDNSRVVVLVLWGGCCCFFLGWGWGDSNACITWHRKLTQLVSVTPLHRYKTMYMQIQWAKVNTSTFCCWCELREQCRVVGLCLWCCVGVGFNGAMF